MSERKLTSENVAELFGRKREATAPTEPTGEQERKPSTEQPQGSPDQLTADQLELATRYGLTAQEVRRVRGSSWAEKCADAERLAAIVEQEPNRGEIAALAAHKAERHERIVGLFHPPAKSEDGEGS